MMGRIKDFIIGVTEFLRFMMVPLIIVFMFGIVVYATQLEYVIKHEEAHQSIYDAFGIESRVEMDYVTLSGVTIASMQEYEEKCAGTNCQLLQELNEIVSYNNSYIMMTLYGVGSILVLIAILIMIELNTLNKNFKNFVGLLRGEE